MIEVAIALILLVVVVRDLQQFRISNVAVLLLLACVVLGWVSSPFEHVVSHTLFAAAALAILFGAFSLRLIGGGDAKLLGVALLWVGPRSATNFALLLFACSLVYALGASARILPARRDGKRTIIPWGPSIAAAWLGLLFLSREG